MGFISHVETDFQAEITVHIRGGKPLKMPVRACAKIPDIEIEEQELDFGGITFGDFMDFLSSLSKGSEEEKIMWSFRFYDINKDGIISRDEMIKVCKK